MRTENLYRDEEAAGDTCESNDPGDDCPDPDLHRELPVNVPWKSSSRLLNHLTYTRQLPNFSFFFS
jgi:hypothetical protein